MSQCLPSVFQGYADYGKDAGCSFISSSCTSFASSNSNQDFFCSASGSFQCSYDNRYMVYCSEVPPWPSFAPAGCHNCAWRPPASSWRLCLYVPDVPFRVLQNTYYNPGCVTGAPFSTSVISNSQSDSNCFDPSQHEANARFGFYYGQNSRCIDIASTVQYNVGNGFFTTRVRGLFSPSKPNSPAPSV